MKLNLRQLLPVFLISTSLILTGCFEKKEEEVTAPSTDDSGGGATNPPATHDYDYVTLTYPSVSGTYHAGVATFTAVSATTNIVSGSLTNFTVSPSLPYGLQLNSQTGEISEMPTVGGVFGNWSQQNYTVSAQKPNNEGAVTAVLNFGVSISGNPVDNTTDHSDLRFPQRELTLIVGQAMTPITPSYNGPQDVTFYTSFNQSNSPTYGQFGLSFDNLTGTISGTPTYPVDKQIFSVSDASGHLNAYVIITIIEGAPTNLHYANESATYPVGHPITVNTPSASGGNVASYSVSPALPTGLTLNTTTGEITGTPSVVTATANYTITATNIAGSGSNQISITISDSAPANLSYVNVTSRYTVGASITANTPIITGGGQPTSYSVNPALPAGLSLDTTTGVITGLPTAMTAAASYTVTATNALGSANKVIGINVVNPGSHVLYAGNGSILKAYSVDALSGEPIFIGKQVNSDVTSKLIFHPTSDCAFGYSGGAAVSFLINKSDNGQLTVVSAVGGLSGPKNMVMTSNGKFLFAINNQDPSTQFVMKYEINSSNCSLSAAANTNVWRHTENVVRDIATFDDNVYVLYRDKKIRHFKFDNSTGALTVQTDYSMVAANGVNALFLRSNPAGTQLYASDDQDGIERLSADMNGALTSHGRGRDGNVIISTSVPPVVDPVNNHYVHSVRNGFSQFGMQRFGIQMDGSFNGGNTLLGTQDVIQYYSLPQTLSIHASDSGSYIYSTFTPSSTNIPNPSAVRVKIEADGSMTSKGFGLVGNISGY